jgi:hypothetical protein
MRELFAAGLMALALAAPAVAQTGGDGFSIAERRILLEYFASHGTKPSQDGKPALPRRIEVGDKLPDGMQAQPLPTDLSEQLPVRPARTQIMQLDDDLLLLENGSRKVLDVLIDGARG